MPTGSLSQLKRFTCPSIRAEGAYIVFLSSPRIGSRLPLCNPWHSRGSHACRTPHVLPCNLSCYSARKGSWNHGDASIGSEFNVAIGFSEQSPPTRKPNQSVGKARRLFSPGRRDRTIPLFPIQPAKKAATESWGLSTCAIADSGPTRETFQGNLFCRIWQSTEVTYFRHQIRQMNINLHTMTKMP
jgi:hypothetical protein